MSKEKSRKPKLDDQKGTDIVLTDQQKEFIDKYHANFKTLKAITQRTFDDESLDGRSQQGYAIKRYMREKKYKIITTGDTVPRDSNTILTEEQKIFIINNAKTCSPMEMARILFDNPSLAPLGKEKRAVDEFLRTITKRDDPVINDETGEFFHPYEAPQSVHRLIPIVREKTGRNIKNGDELSREDRISLDALLVYVNNYRYKRAIENYETQEDRNLFEASFIDYTIDKPDLTQAELQSYINVCTDQVKMHKYERQLDRLNNKRNEELKKNKESLIKYLN
jgi:hypothetical protein